MGWFFGFGKRALFCSDVVISLIYGEINHRIKFT